MKLWLMAAALVLSALALSAPNRAHAQDGSIAALEYEAPPPHPSRVARGHSTTSGRRASIGFGVAGIVLGAVGMVVGGPVLLIAGTSHSHCEGGWLTGRPHTCSPLPDDGGQVAGGAISLGLGFVGVLTGIILVAMRPSATAPRLSLGGDTSSLSISIDGTF